MTSNIKYRNRLRETPARPDPRGVPIERGGRARPAGAPTGRATAAEYGRWFGRTFTGSQAAYATFTLSDDAARTMRVFTGRQALRSVRAFLRRYGVTTFVCTVEPHRHRSTPHVHALLMLPAGMTRTMLWAHWRAATESHARILPVLDGCASYVTKYVLKDATADSMDWSV